MSNARLAGLAAFALLTGGAIAADAQDRNAASETAPVEDEERELEGSGEGVEEVSERRRHRREAAAKQHHREQDTKHRAQ